MKTSITDGQVTYTGFDPQDNGKWIIKSKNNWTYVNFQQDEFTQIIFGYVVKQNEINRYKAYQFGDRNVRYFDDVNNGIEYIKSLKE